MAAVLNCSVDTLGRRFAEVIEKGRKQGNMSLKRKQYEVAMGGNVTMLIWLGKQRLDQTDKVEQRFDAKIEQVNNTEVLAKQLTEILKTANEIK